MDSCDTEWLVNFGTDHYLDFHSIISTVYHTPLFNMMVLSPNDINYH